MKNTTVKKLLLAKGKPFQLVLALFGAFLGLLIFMAGFQVYRDMKTLLVEKDLIGGDYIVINKRIGILNTIGGGGAPTFTENEIADLQKVEGLSKIGKFSAATFQIKIVLSGELAESVGGGFQSLMFFEAVPDDFVDVAREEWHWSPKDATVPVIIPADYLKQYNNAFAESQNFPVIPEFMIKMVTFDIHVSGQGKSAVFQGRIVGFSDRINTILVPQSFLDFGNKNYGNVQSKKPSRLILHSEDPTAPKLASDLRSKGYQLNEEKLRSSEINGILQILVTIVSAVGVMIVFLAFLGFMQYTQLMAYRSAYEIQTLHWLGFRISALAGPYIRFAILSVSITWIGASIAIWLVHGVFSDWLLSKGFSSILPQVWFAIISGFVISLLMALFSCLAAYRQVKQLAA